MKALVGAFNQEIALVGAFSVIVKTGCETDGPLHSTSRYGCVARASEGWWRDVKISIPKLLRLFVVNAAVPECDAVSTVQSIQTLHHHNMPFFYLISLQNMQNMFNHWQYISAANR